MSGWNDSRNLGYSFLGIYSTRTNFSPFMWVMDTIGNSGPQKCKANILSTSLLHVKMYLKIKGT